MRFQYRARNKEGEEIIGRREAADDLSLSRAMRAEGLTLILAKPLNKKASAMDFLNSLFVRVKVRDKITFADNLGSMIGAGLSLSRALDVIERQSSNKRFKELVKNIAHKVRNGSSLKDTLAERKDVFPPVFISMVGAGEESGRLPESLSIVAEQLTKNYELKRKIKGAMMYPAIIVMAIFLIGILMMIYVIPTLTATFKDLNIDLPLSTRFVIWISDFLSGNKIYILIGFPLLIIFSPRVIKTKAIKRLLERIFLRLPIIGKIIRKINSAVTMRTLSSLISSGVSMIEAITITEDVLQNGKFKAVMEKARKEVQRGIPLSQVFREEEYLYPVLVGEMAAVGEETGNLPAMLMKGALFYEKEVEQVTKNLSTVIEPVLMILIGIAVGFFAISMLSPMYSLTDAIK